MRLCWCSTTSSSILMVLYIVPLGSALVLHLRGLRWGASDMRHAYTELLHFL